ncbi:MAG: hypothetical protein P8M72_10455 [Gammaproteobacteria bacterium]|nr:hypothetical protein [Gammaproteobacteria bacterium]
MESSLSCHIVAALCACPGPDALALFATAQALRLEVQQVVRGHGGALFYQSLVEIANNNAN